MALTAGKQKRPLADGDQDYAGQLGNSIVYAGGIVMLDSSGRAKKGTAETGGIGVGIAIPNGGLDRYDATATGPLGVLADNVQKVKWEEGIFCVKNSGTTPFLSSDQPGLCAYIEDDETVCKTGTGKSPAGIFHHIDADGVWIAMSKEIGAFLLVLTTAADAAAAHLAGSETFTGVKTFASGADPVFAKEAAHTLKVAASTTAATAGGALTVKAGDSGTSGAGGALALAGGAAAAGGGGNGGAASLDTGAKDGAGTDATLTLGGTNAAAITLGRAGKLITRQGPTAQGAATDTIADPGTGAAIPVTQNGVCMITTAAAETNTLAIPTFVGQELCLIMDTRVGGDRVVTSAQAINQAGNTIMTFGAAADMIVLRGMKVGGALRWRVVANDGVALS